MKYSKLDGMFALAIWDTQIKKLYLQEIFSERSLYFILNLIMMFFFHQKLNLLQRPQCLIIKFLTVP